MVNSADSDQSSVSTIFAQAYMFKNVGSFRGLLYSIHLREVYTVGNYVLHNYVEHHFRTYIR